MRFNTVPLEQFLNSLNHSITAEAVSRVAADDAIIHQIAREATERTQDVARVEGKIDFLINELGRLNAVLSKLSQQAI